ncbi:MAG: tyrosine--tRNA ligase [Acidimicrobiales bacterium]|nr:tyrosine--tRNA ligase [Acidimicrobiales bacterium]
MSPLFADLQWRRLVHQVTDPALAGQLDRGGLSAYGGFDPSADSLHVGNLVLILMLRRLQLAGHRPVALAGGGTGLVGDPGGKTEERDLADRERTVANVAAIRAQLEGLLDFEGGPGRPAATVVNNLDWLGGLSLLEFLRDVGKHFTVNQMMAKESVRGRLSGREQGISYAEFSYMLLQAYDFLHLFDAVGCRLQIGGSDQWGNITMGVDLVRRLRGEQAFGLTTPLVVKADGTKFGKTEEGTVWLDPDRTSPYAFYQYFVRTPDAEVGLFLRYFTFLERSRIEELDREVAERPERQAAQRALAREVTTLVHGEAEAARAERAAAALFGQQLAELDERSLLEVFADAPSSEVARSVLEGPGWPLVDALVTSGLAPSKGRARDLIEQGGAYLNDGREREPDRQIGKADLLHDRYLVLRKGRRDYHLVRVG